MVFLCLFALFSLLSVCIVWLFVFAGTGVSAPCGQVKSVCVAIDAFGFLAALRCHRGCLFLCMLFCLICILKFFFHCILKISKSLVSAFCNGL